MTFGSSAVEAEGGLGGGGALGESALCTWALAARDWLPDDFDGDADDLLGWHPIVAGVDTKLCVFEQD